jgi:hypothetical protein
MTDLVLLLFHFQFLLSNFPSIAIGTYSIIIIIIIIIIITIIIILYLHVIILLLWVVSY